MRADMPKTVAVAIACVALATAAFADDGPFVQTTLDGYKVVQVNITNQADVNEMLSISELFWACELGPGPQLWTVSPERMAALEQSGLEYAVLHENMQELLDRERAQRGRGGRGWFDDFRTFDEINSRINTLVASWPNLVSRFTVGNSLQGRTVYGMTITSPVGSNKPGFVFNATQHAREWISPMTVMFIAEELVSRYDTDSDIRALLDRVVVYIVPVVNPDGYVYTWTNNRMWRKNRRSWYGVDLNRNWSFGWGGPGSSGSLSSETYRGSAPFSEPETANLRNFVLAHPEIVAHIDFHSYSQLILYPYGYDYVVPEEPELTTYVDLSAHMADVIDSVYGAKYVDQPAHDLYLASGVMVDWAHEEANAYSWTIELRPGSTDFGSGNGGFIIGADAIIPTGEENFAAVKFMIQYLTQPLVFQFPYGVATAVIGNQPTVMPVEIVESSGTLDTGSPRLFYRVGNSGPFAETGMVYVSEDRYDATLPGSPCDAEIQYYVQAQTVSSSVVTSPPDAPATVYKTYGITPALVDDMETDLGWTVGAPDDDATSGVWTRMDPELTQYRGERIQSGRDHSPNGVICWVTDGAAGDGAFDNEVEGGKTTLLTPIIDLTAGPDPRIGYWRWYYNNAVLAPADDVLVIDISNNAGGSWVNVETIGPEGVETDGGWWYHEFRVADFVAPTDQVQMRFIASDEGEASLVEVAIDDFIAFDIGCTGPACPGDLNGDGVIDLGDLSQLLANYPTASGATYEDGDVDGDGDVDLSDLSAVLAVYGGSCP